jgi:hypothetical protein
MNCFWKHTSILICKTYLWLITLLLTPCTSATSGRGTVEMLRVVPLLSLFNVVRFPVDASENARQIRWPARVHDVAHNREVQEARLCLALVKVVFRHEHQVERESLRPIRVSEGLI